MTLSPLVALLRSFDTTGASVSLGGGQGVLEDEGQ